MAGLVTHDQYYDQFVTDAIRKTVADRLTVCQLKEAGEHFNGIPLSVWDNLGKCHHGAIDRLMRGAGDFLSLAGAVCVLKRAAAQLLQETHA